LELLENFHFLVNYPFKSMTKIEVILQWPSPAKWPQWTLLDTDCDYR